MSEQIDLSEKCINCGHFHNQHWWMLGEEGEGNPRCKFDNCNCQHFKGRVDVMLEAVLDTSFGGE